MKKNFRLVIMALGILAIYPVMAQKDNIGIGTSKPDESAVLDVSSSTKGLLIPRMNLQQRNKIQNPASGLMIYQTDILSGFYYYNGSEWKSMGNSYSENSIADDPNDWTKTGNTGVTSANFIGTLSGGGNTFRIKVEGQNFGYISSLGKATFFGLRSGNVDANGTSTAFGYRTLELNTTGQDNSAFGNTSLISNTTGYNNSAFGAYTMYSNTIGRDNLAVGGSALALNVSGNSNVAIGASSLYSNTIGDANVAIGSSSLLYNTGNYNTGVGAQSLYSNTSGVGNFALGFGALRSNTTGNNNLGVGWQAGYSNVSGDNNIFIGNQAGYNETGANKIYISNSNTDLPLIYGDFSAKFISIGDVGVTGDPVATAAKRNSLSTQYGLLVQKGILTEKIKVATMTTTDWADYVFDKDYKRMSLEQVEKYVVENKHLPNVPTTADMILNGSDLIKTDAKLLEKIEELTLYIIEMNKEIKALKAENAKIRK